MIWYYILLYALIQGVTEFLPISSSGHLILAHEWVDGQSGVEALNDPSKKWAEDAVIDIAVHVGTLFSVLLYFWRDFFGIARGVLLSIGSFVTPKSARNTDVEAAQGLRMACLIILASMPVIIAGYLLHEWQPEWLRSPKTVAWTTLIFAYVLWLADRFRPAELVIEKLTVKSALLIGCAQVLALIPGTSRSGITMTAARALGFTRDAAARFSLFLAVVLGLTLGSFHAIAESQVVFHQEPSLYSGQAVLRLLYRHPAVRAWCHIPFSGRSRMRPQHPAYA